MIFPIKPQILYAPMLSTFGGGSANGFKASGGSPDFDMTYRQMSYQGSAAGNDVSLGQQTPQTVISACTITAAKGVYANLADHNYYNIDGDGILRTSSFPQGTYYYEIKGGDGGLIPARKFRGTVEINRDISGSGNYNGYNVFILPALNGSGEYGAGGGTFLVQGTFPGTAFNNASSLEALVVAGGSGGNYRNAVQSPMNSGDPTDNTSTASTRISNTGNRGYCGGAGMFDTYTVEEYSNNRARHFVQGGRGSRETSCGTNQEGGLGGGGGGCPGGAGGYVGGYPGGDGPQSSGSGGTSYYNSGAGATLSYSEPAFTSQVHSSNHSGFQTAHCGYLRLSDVPF